MGEYITKLYKRHMKKNLVYFIYEGVRLYLTTPWG